MFLLYVYAAKDKFEDEETGEDLTLVLNDDKTEVDDEEYFQTLPDNTVFVIVQAGGGGRGRQRHRHCHRWERVLWGPILE